MSGSPRRAGTTAAVFALALLAGCGGDDGGATEATGEERPPATRPGQSGVCLPGGSTVRREGSETPDPVMLIEVDVAPEACLDAVTFEFESTGVNLPPRYEAEYDNGPFFTGDGEEREEVEIAGEAHLVVTFDETYDVDLRDPEFPPIYEGPTTIQPGGMNFLEEVRRIADADGHMTWVIGLEAERPFKVDGSASPPKVEITIG